MVQLEFQDFTTDSQRWRLRTDNGRQTWHYLSEQEAQQSAKQNVIEHYWLGTLTRPDSSTSQKPNNAQDFCRRGFQFFKQLQCDDGHWAGEYGGPLFLLAGIVTVYHVTGIRFEEAQRLEIVRYVKNTRALNGGWGLHIEGKSIMLCTVLNYVVLRLLGIGANDPVCVAAREFIVENGTAAAIPSWGKFWLAVLNVYDWRGVNPLLPELWILPSWLPFHPSKLWCHARQIYLPMSFVYAAKYQCQDSELIMQLRHELYAGQYAIIDWDEAKNLVAETDKYAPHHPLLDWANYAMSFYEWMAPSGIRQVAQDEVLFQIRCDDMNTDFISIGPISKMINMLVSFMVDGKDSFVFKAHIERCRDYLWIGPDGMRMQGTNGSQLWDTAFVAMALYESGLALDIDNNSSVRNILDFLDDSQLKIDVQDRERCYRDKNMGAFPFSTRDCGWIVSDCTAEALRAVIALQSLPEIEKMISDDRLLQCADVLLDMQNSDGGFASYEKRRGPFWLELMNPSEVFGEIMVDYSYVECTGSVVQALVAVRDKYPRYKRAQIDLCITKGIKFILDQQLLDGSWFGSWGVCFTYGAWFAMEALAATGFTYENCEELRLACQFLLNKQRHDGGWGESYLACTEKRYVHHKTSQVVNTSWALLSLLAAKYPDHEPMRRASEFIQSRQLDNGEWAQEGIEGVFNKTCMISYPNYKFIFPIWALGKYSRRFDQ